MPPDDVSYPAPLRIVEKPKEWDYSGRRIVSVSWITGRGCGQMAEDDADQTAVPLDDVDRNIIAELTRDGRMSVTQVAENVHISRAHAYTRIARLTGEGVLTKFTALVDPIKAGLKSSAYVTLKVRQHSWRELRELLRAIPEVHHIALVGGDFDVILLVRAVDNIDLRRVIFDQLQSMPGVLDTQTFLVFEDVDTR